MSVRRNLFLSILASILFNTNAFAQTETPAPSTQATRAAETTVTAAANAGGGVRFAAPAAALQLRLELYAADGSRVFDSGARAGSVLDWQPSDAPQGVADGAYLCVLTFKDLQGRARQRLGTARRQLRHGTTPRRHRTEHAAGFHPQTAHDDDTSPPSPLTERCNFKPASALTSTRTRAGRFKESSLTP